MDAAARQLLIKLLALWRDWPERRAWYLAEHIPKVITAGPDAGRNLEERIALGSIRTHLDSEEWEALGLLVVQVDQRDQGVVAEFRAQANRARAWAAEEEQRARSAETRRQSEAEEDDRRARRAERAREREGQLAAERAAAEVERQRLAAVEAAKREERTRIERERAAEKTCAAWRSWQSRLELHFLDASEWLKVNDPDGLITGQEFQNAVAKHVMSGARGI